MLPLERPTTPPVLISVAQFRPEKVYHVKISFFFRARRRTESHHILSR
jgi:alpha-1,2-mannosyltransferase